MRESRLGKTRGDQEPAEAAWPNYLQQFNMLLVHPVHWGTSPLSFPGSDGILNCDVTSKLPIMKRTMMKKMLFLSLVLGLILQFFYFRLLPQNVAHLFDADGLTLGYLIKKQYILFTTLALLSNSIICLMADTVFKRLPQRYIHFPNKSYWLAAERKDDAIRQMAKWTDFFGISINSLLMILFLLIFKANALDPPQLNMQLFFITLVIFTLVTAGWLIAFSLEFRSPK